MFEQLGNAIDELKIPVDSDALAAVLALRDRLDARIADAVAAHDHAGLWQLDGATTNLDADTVGLFAECEAEIVPTLAALSVADVAATMRAWRDCATADRPPKPEQPHGLHLSGTLANRWRLDGDLAPRPASCSPPPCAWP